MHKPSTIEKTPGFSSIFKDLENQVEAFHKILRNSLRDRAVAINKDPTIFHLFSPQHQPVMLALMLR